MAAMIYGYARVSTDGQSVAAQVQQLTHTMPPSRTVFRCDGVITPRPVMGAFEQGPLQERLARMAIDQRASRT